MYRKVRFKFKDRVNAVSLDGKAILGEYRGVRDSFGVLVWGIQVGSFEPASMHVCSSLTLRKVVEKKPKKPRKTDIDRFEVGDKCAGKTRTGQIIKGVFMNPAGEFAWIKQWQEDIPRFEWKAFKVLKSTLRKL